MCKIYVMILLSRSCSSLLDSHRVSLYVAIKTHDSELRGQEEAGRTRRTSELFTHSTTVKLAKALNKLS